MIIKPCKGSDAFEFIPEREMKLDLYKIANYFDEIKIKTRIVIIVKYKGIDVSIYPSGRMLIHTTDKDKAISIASAIKRIIYE
ncbi:MAG: hypothetical protein DRP03_00875 [Candidatus Aenigmatarchaeota archaeon]|nr:MAG: hypothetical protein DRP03_00875 [Candidatus Aenigmarchaeota archaeon]